VVLEQDGRRFTRSAAAVRMLAGLGGAWRLAWALLIVPRPLRDAGYDWVARNRYRWFGAASACLPPEARGKGRFLK
jgi:predicted DCC family thiol-disulfide oxidoreductase YuxK